MKSLNATLARVLAGALLCAGFASSSFAATKPLSYPKGLAVDAKGNLYVANSGGNDILVYSSSYTQMTSKTITQNISNPSAVAFDPWDNLWVANYGTSNGGANGSVAEYTNGVQNTANSITNGILGPNAMAIDSLGNILVVNDNVNISIYAATWPDYPATSLARIYTPTFPVYGVAVGHGEALWGGNSAVTVVTEGPLLIDGAADGFGWTNDTGFAMASDAKGNVYMGNLNGTVNINEVGFEAPFLQLSFTPAGIAVDSVRGRVYISNSNGNSISVYSTAGALLKTIE